ncbi:hypothetical protein [Streptomyces regalis]|uniref:Uncharacterized protein n=1 Tax=Streptomyces regalis TaxID=68262 RepID=A0A0X3VKX6_9ACTN|nr:hypothetical protein [Streptomyces regalis]KUL45433.1 hypothetical protein ADL12_03580 [Streptomyces regalis]
MWTRPDGLEHRPQSSGILDRGRGRAKTEVARRSGDVSQQAAPARAETSPDLPRTSIDTGSVLTAMDRGR